MTPPSSRPEALSALRPRTAAYPRTEIGESFLVNVEWHGPRCASNRTGMYRDCDCTLIREIVALEREAAAQAEGSLDVPLLAEALAACDLEGEIPADERAFWRHAPQQIEYAERIAAEYQRLAEKPHD